MSPRLERTRKAKLSKKTARTTPSGTMMGMIFSTMRSRGTAHEQNEPRSTANRPPLGERQPMPEITPNDILVEGPSTSDMAKTGYPYSRNPCCKKLKPTDPNTGAVNKELLVPADRYWASTKAQVKIAQMKMQHDLELAKLYLQYERQMPKDKIKADQRCAWYKSIQPAGINSANRAVLIGGAVEPPWYMKLVPAALLSLDSSPASSPL
ncbi:hypothetical protein BDK51DRAFT_26199 [Blyttiomyces helicus]|uniref:Uncharacterized protein n=1 Tax=Blyttiomyces helicus TaxID=388810 RepID=A0A4V1ISQ9_9FUNG|nr:hypothetical protein BDK51DRAFT_26199 [Blyttiomyces helicus]|eukprot:RKO94417.1 hypothetical protein BDK51DRAFT_26199 [Blyttiomyces helicus]